MGDLRREFEQRSWISPSWKGKERDGCPSHPSYQGSLHHYQGWCLAGIGWRDPNLCFRLEEALAPEWERLIKPKISCAELRPSLAHKPFSIKTSVSDSLSSLQVTSEESGQRLGTVKHPKPLGGFLIPGGNRLQVV